MGIKMKNGKYMKDEKGNFLWKHPKKTNFSGVSIQEAWSIEKGIHVQRPVRQPDKETVPASSQRLLDLRVQTRLTDQPVATPDQPVSLTDFAKLQAAGSPSTASSPAAGNGNGNNGVSWMNNHRLDIITQMPDGTKRIKDPAGGTSILMADRRLAAAPNSSSSQLCTTGILKNVPTAISRVLYLWD